jgi:hypothetical protein
MMAIFKKSTNESEANVENAPAAVQAMASEDAFTRWEEELEDHVSAAINELPAAPLGEEMPLEDRSLAMEEEIEESVQKRLPGEHNYISELVVDSNSGPADIFQVCQALKPRVKGELVRIGYSKRGATITCTVPDPITLFRSLGNIGHVASWSVAAQ